MEYDLPVGDLLTHPTEGVATKAARYFAAKLQERLMAALQKAMGEKAPKTLDDVKQIAHRVLIIHTEKERWYYIDDQCFFGHTVTAFDVDWSEGKATFAMRELPLEDAPPVPRKHPVATFKLDRPIEPPADA